jgi:glycerol kinase
VSAPYVMALDEGSSSARTLIIDREGTVVAEAHRPITPIFPRPGWVELDPEAIWQLQLATMREAVAKVGCTARDIGAIGITSHRESAFLWERRTGLPVHHAIMWMSKQTDPIVQRWSADGLDDEIRERTGLYNDSYFSAGKLAWFMENLPGCRERAGRGELAFGTPDAWLMWSLTKGRSHRTDHSCASRTAIFNLEQVGWDTRLCETFGIPTEILPEALPSDAHFGYADAEWLGAEIPITAVLADQQAGLFGHACFEDGAAKNTFGTAGVLTVNAGPRPLHIDGLTTSAAWTVGGATTYEIEGVVFHSGQTLQWLRDNLHLIADARETAAVARRTPDTGGVYFVPAFAGLCAPHWARHARAAIVGLTLESGVDHVVRAALESIAYQTKDNVEALLRSSLVDVPELKVDGGAVSNDELCQFQADILGIPVMRPHGLERTGLGVAYLAGIGVGSWAGLDDVRRSWAIDRVFEPQMADERRQELYAGWQAAVLAACTQPGSPESMR